MEILWNAPLGERVEDGLRVNTCKDINDSGIQIV